MSDIDIRIEGRAGRITLHRPKALNALSSAMVDAIDAVLPQWEADAAVAVVVIDAEGDRAFCAGGDLAEIYAAGKQGDFALARDFWRLEYRMNARLDRFAKPVVSLMQGYTMGGGVGLGCHASHRIVCENSRIAMPEVGIGLVPDVGGSLLLSRSPGYLGCYLGCTTRRMAAADAIFAGFADHFVSREDWRDLIAALVAHGDTRAVAEAARPAPSGDLPGLMQEIDRTFCGETFSDIIDTLAASETQFARQATELMQANDPLAMAAAVRMNHRLRGETDIRNALELEYRFTYRAPESGDFLEGIRALIVDKDRAPRWRHRSRSDLEDASEAMLAELGDLAWTYESEGKRT